MAKRKIVLKKDDEKDIREHLSNIKQVSDSINNFINQRAKEIKALERVWEVTWLCAKVEKKLPMEVTVPKLVDIQSLRLNISINEGVASWDEKPLKVKPKKPKVVIDGQKLKAEIESGKTAEE